MLFFYYLEVKEPVNFSQAEINKYAIHLLITDQRKFISFTSKNYRMGSDPSRIQTYDLQLSLPHYVTIAKQVLCKDYRFGLYLYHHNRMRLHHHPMLVCCSLEYIITILKFLQDTIGILPSRGIGSYVTISFI
jgi:hypothetical protein